MVRIFFFILLGLIVGGILYAVLGNEPGYVLVSWGNWAVETSLLMGMLVLLLLLVLVFILRWLLMLFRPLLNWSSRGRQTRAADEATLAGLRMLAHGNARPAYKLLLEHARHARSPLLNYLGGFVAAVQLGDQAGMRYTLDKAESLAASEPLLSVGLIKAGMAMRSGQLESALAILLDLHQRGGDNPTVLLLLKDVLCRLEDWEQLATLLPAMEAAGVVDEETARALQLQSVSRRLEAFNRRQGGADGLEALRDELPRDQRMSESVMLPYIRQLIALGEYERAQVMLIRFFRGHWSDALVRLTGYIETRDPAPLRVLLEKQLQEHPGNALLSLSLARVCVRNGMVDKAREYLEAAAVFSADVDLSAEVNAELGRLFEHQGDSENSATCYRKAMNYFNKRLPELPWG